MDLSQTIIDLNKLQGAADDLARAVHPLSMSVAQVGQARAQWAEIWAVAQAINDSPLGASDEDGEPQVSVENTAKLKRMGLDAKYVGIRSESQLLEMKEQEEAEEKKALESVAEAKAKGVAAARARFGR